MRGLLLSLVCAAGLLALTPAKSIASSTPAHGSVSAPAPVFAVMQADKKLDVNITAGSGGGNSGGGGTTIVK